MVLQWSPEEHTIKPISLHSWEKEDAITAGRVSFPAAAAPCSDLQVWLRWPAVFQIIIIKKQFK